MKTIQEIMSEKGYPVADNRSYNWKSLNKALQNGFEIAVVEKGYHMKKESIKGGKYNIIMRYKAAGKVYRSYRNFARLGSDCVGDIMVNEVIRFRNMMLESGAIDIEEIKKGKGMELCEKCHGKGIIPQFMHVCKGVCFDCMGLGYGKQGLIHAHKQ